jgi:hypothetical protein
MLIKRQNSLQNIIDTKDNSLIKSDIYNGKYSKTDGVKATMF